MPRGWPFFSKPAYVTVARVYNRLTTTGDMHAASSPVSELHGMLVLGVHLCCLNYLNNSGGLLRCSLHLAVLASCITRRVPV